MDIDPIEIKVPDRLSERSYQLENLFLILDEMTTMPKKYLMAHQDESSNKEIFPSVKLKYHPV